MPRSLRTLQLNAAAHQLGDQYYRALTDAARWGTGLDDTCIDLAYAYLEALETLHAHLWTIPRDPDVELHIRTTEGNIKLVRTDLAHFHNGGDPRNR